MGLNLFYYTYLHRNTSIEKLVQEILQPVIEHIEEPWLRLLEYSDGVIVFNYSSKEPLLLRVSEAWYPYWKVYIDNNLCKCMSRDRLGLIQLNLPAGEHIVRLEFRDPYLVLRYVSTAALALLALIVLAKHRLGAH